MSRVKQQTYKGNLGKRKRVADVETTQISKKPATNRPQQITYDETVSMMDPSLIADHFAKALKKHSSNSTTLELEEKYVSRSSIRDTTSFSQPHLAKHLSAYLETFSGGRQDLEKGETAAPHTLIITLSGIRAADLAREVRAFGKADVKVAKLFAKHMKLAESVAFVQKTKINIAVGTPQRPKELIEHEVLKLDGLKRIVIDGSYVDEKKRTIFDIAEVFLPMIETLNLDSIKTRLGADTNGIEVLVF